jgi:hypothetical protein
MSLYPVFLPEFNLHWLSMDDIMKKSYSTMKALGTSYSKRKLSHCCRNYELLYIMNNWSIISLPTFSSVSQATIPIYFTNST